MGLLLLLVANLLALLVVGMLIVHRQQERRRKAVASLSGPYCLPAIGAVHLFFNLDTKTLLPKINEYVLKHGKIMRAWAFNRLLILSSDLELNEQLLASSQHLTKQRNYRLLQPWLGNGLLLSDGRNWHARRKIITPTFHFIILEEFIELFDQHATTFLSNLAKHADGTRAFDIYPYVCLAALDIIAETAMGTKVYAQSDANSDYASAVNELTKLMAWRFLKIHLQSELVFSLMHPYKKFRQMQLIKKMHKFTVDVIEERRLALTDSQRVAAFTAAQDNCDAYFCGKKRLAFLDVLLGATMDGKPLSNEDIREEVDTFMFEGHDTTTSAISFALHLLARHLQVQQKLFDEVYRVLGGGERGRRSGLFGRVNKGGLLTLQALSELKYLDCVIKETLRLYPPVPIIGREILRDFKYTHSQLGNGIIPAGTEFFIIIQAMMRNGDYFADPLQFQPERHLEKAATSAFANIPFSAGPRNCIGQKFAMLEMKTIIAKTVLAYELLPLGDAVMPELNIVLRSTNGFQLGLRKR